MPAMPSDLMRDLARRHAPEAQLRVDKDGAWFVSLFRYRPLSALLYERPDGVWEGRVYVAWDGSLLEERTGPAETVFAWAMGRTAEEYRG